jgi:HlyD family secretion protein
MSDESAKRQVSDAGVTRTAFDQLDTLIQVTNVHAWVYLAALFAIGAASVVFSVLYEVPTKVNGDGLLLIEQDTLVQIRARATGRLTALDVRLGDCVAPDQEIGRVAREDLDEQIHEAEAKLTDLRRQDDELTRFEKAEAASKDAAMAQLQDALNTARVDGLDKLQIAGRVVVGANRLRAEKHLGDLELLESREKFYDVRDDLNNGKTRLAELGLDRVTAENARKRAQLERRLKIDELATKIRLDREKLEKTSSIVSPARGQVAQVQSVVGGLVQQGAPVVLLHAPKAKRGADDAGSTYDAIVFVSAGEGKKIEIDDPVEVVPATVKREEHGFIRGHVVDVAELPATKLAMEAALEHPEMVEAFLKRYAPGVVLRVQIKLEEAGGAASKAKSAGRSERKNPFRWSSSSGPAQSLKTGTMCQAAIVVERRPLIRLILPWTRKVSGTD